MHESFYIKKFKLYVKQTLTKFKEVKKLTQSICIIWLNRF